MSFPVVRALLQGKALVSGHGDVFLQPIYYDAYQAKTERVIPVFIAEPR